MSFFKSLKKAFTYTGLPDDDNDSDSSEKEDNRHSSSVRPRISIGNPIQRIKDVKDDALKIIKSTYGSTTPTISDHTKYLVYESLHNEVEKRLGKGKPVEEARILYNRFLEEHVTDESLYNDEDLEYIATLVRYMKELHRLRVPSDIDRDYLIKEITNHPRFLNIIEVLDVQYGYRAMDFFCERSYIICGYFYKSKGRSLASLAPTKIPHFYLEINDSTFILLNEVKTLVSNDSSLLDKETYVIKKISSFFEKYVYANDLPNKVLFDVLSTFNNLIPKEDVVESSRSAVNEYSPEVYANSAFKGEEVLTEAQIQEKMFEGINNEANPIKTLHKDEKFANLYGPLADPRNPDVTMDDLEEAIKDIENMMAADAYELAMDEFKIFSTIKRRLDIMKRGED